MSAGRLLRVRRDTPETPLSGQDALTVDTIEGREVRRRTTSTFGVIAAVCIALGIYLLTRPGTTPSGPSTQPSTPRNTPHWGVQSKTAGCTPHAGLPDATCTPGDVLASATKAAICTPGYARSVRNVPQSVKTQVYTEYGITRHAPGQYEVDHLVSLQLGGSNAVANLWPEAASPKPGFHEKDQVENYLHDQICSGAISLQEAQTEIATNWLDVYHRMSTKSSTSPSDGSP